jgi:hypothetical protein
VRAITVIAEAARAMAVHATTASTQEAATTRERAAASIEDVEARATLAERGGVRESAALVASARVRHEDLPPNPWTA